MEIQACKVQKVVQELQHSCHQQKVCQYGKFILHIFPKKHAQCLVRSQDNQKRRMKLRIMFLMIEPTRCTNFSKFYFGMKLYMFWTVPLSIIRSFSLCTQQWFMSYRFADSLRAGSGWNCNTVPS